MALLQVWQPSEPIRGERFQRGGPAIAGAAVADPAMEAEIRRKEDDHKDTKGEIVVAYAPYLIIIAIFGIAQIGPIKTFLADLGSEFSWPGLDITDAGRRGGLVDDVQVQLGDARPARCCWSPAC